MTDNKSYQLQLKCFDHKIIDQTNKKRKINFLTGQRTQYYNN